MLHSAFKMYSSDEGLFSDIVSFIATSVFDDNNVFLKVTVIIVFVLMSWT